MAITLIIMFWLLTMNLYLSYQLSVISQHNDRLDRSIQQLQITIDNMYDDDDDDDFEDMPEPPVSPEDEIDELIRAVNKPGMIGTPEYNNA